MKDLCLYLLGQLAENTEEVSVDETESEDGNVTLTVHVAKEDMGRIIGKEGKVINALRDVIKILAVKQNKHVDIVLAE